MSEEFKPEVLKYQCIHIGLSLLWYYKNKSILKIIAISALLGDRIGSMYRFLGTYQTKSKSVDLPA